MNRSQLSRRTLLLIAGAVVLVAIVAAAVRISILSHQEPAQSVLPFADLKGPTGVAVDRDADLYVVDELGRQMLELAADSTTQVVVPLQGGSPNDPNVGPVDPRAVAVDSAGDVFVADSYNRNPRVLKLAVGPPPRSCCRSPGSGTLRVSPWTRQATYRHRLSQPAGG